MNRRGFIKLGLAFGSLAASIGLAPPAARLFREAHAAVGRTLVVCFLRGGCDGLNLIVPYREDAYYRERTSIAIAAPGSGNLDRALDLDGTFGLHPAMQSLRAFYLQGQVAFLPAVHHLDASRSHFDCQAEIERAGGYEGSGWLNRYLAATSPAAGLGGMAFGYAAPTALRGAVPVSVLKGLDGATVSDIPGEEARLFEALADDYAVVEGWNHSSLGLVRAAGARAISDARFLRTLQDPRYQTTVDALYPSTLFGAQLRDVARLVKLELGLEVATLDLGGWDTHEAQGSGAPDGRQAALLAMLSAGLAAFMTDLGARAADVTVLVMTEFGRTLAENASGGTDHGNAAAWIALGGSVRGGIYHGPGGWPGLEADQLYEGRDLARAIDSRDVMAECLTRFLGLTAAALGSVLPGGPAQSVGFLA